MMIWITVIPLIIDVLREATKLIAAIQDGEQKEAAREDLRGVLKDFDQHLDIPTLKSNIQQAATRGDRR